MDPATPMQPYTPQNGGGQSPLIPSAPVGPAADSTMGPGSYAPLTVPGQPVQQVNLPAATPPIVPGQPYMSTSAPASSMPMPPVNNPANMMPNTQNMAPNMNPGLPPIISGGDIKSEVIEKLRGANNVLVTVTSNPSVDQLSAAIGITLILNKMGKHATAVYSGETPSVLEFLQPEKTIEKNTDSLRDFIIALDKSKADKLRYKVEDTFVKIFITPYHTSLSEKDLEFSQGDFNVDVILALGVHQREELDQAITAHGRILHDAVTISVNNKQPSDLGAINWFQAEASSLSEMMVSVVEPLQADKILLDEQTSTSFLTGLVAETERFSNAKTTPITMNIAATLMKAGANQQLVSSKLEAPKPVEKPPLQPAPDGTLPIPADNSDGSLEIDHHKEESQVPTKTLQDLEKENSESEEESDLAKIHIDDQGQLLSADKVNQPSAGSTMVTSPPSMGSALSSTGTSADSAVHADVVTGTSENTGLQHAKTVSPLSEEEKRQTLEEIEKSVDSDHLNQVDDPTEAARQAVDLAGASVPPARLEPVQALGAQRVELNKDQPSSDAVGETPGPVQTPVPTPVPDHDLTNEEVFPTQLIGPDKGLPADPTAAPADPTAPPPVPPPMMPTI